MDVEPRHEIDFTLWLVDLEVSQQGTVTVALTGWLSRDCPLFSAGRHFVLELRSEDLLCIRIIVG